MNATDYAAKKSDEIFGLTPISLLACIEKEALKVLIKEAHEAGQKERSLVTKKNDKPMTLEAILLEICHNCYFWSELSDRCLQDSTRCLLHDNAKFVWQAAQEAKFEQKWIQEREGVIKAIQDGQEALYGSVYEEKDAEIRTLEAEIERLAKELSRRSCGRCGKLGPAGQDGRNFRCDCMDKDSKLAKENAGLKSENEKLWTALKVIIVTQ